jgi:DUF2075 family protein
MFRDADKWREHMTELRAMQKLVRYQPGSEDDACLISLVDEAHALINPEREHGVGQYGFVTGLGPQAWQIMRASRVTVFFIDPRQSFRARENTTIQDIKKWAAELDAEVESVSLAGAQFRCAGSAEYVAWVEALLAGSPAEVNRVYASTWRSPGSPDNPIAAAPNVINFPSRGRPVTADGRAELGAGVPHVAENTPSFNTRQFGRKAMDFRVYDSPFELEAALRKVSGDATVRLLSSYSRPWKTDGVLDPHLAPPEGQDFCERVSLGGANQTWSKPWNVVSHNDYTPYVQARPGTVMAKDPLSEVGCPYAVRGFDFGYVGLIWLDDLVWRGDRWVVQVDNVHESGVRLIKTRALHEGRTAPAGPNGTILMEKVGQAYRILLSRAIHGLFVWASDKETRQHLRNSL